MKEPLFVLTSWGGAQYIDLWLIVHLLAGISLGYFVRNFGFTILQTSIIILVVFIGWELYEWLARIPEPWTNSILDMFAGVIGIWLSYKIFLFESFSKNLALSLLLLLIWSGLGLWGWSAWRAREIERSKSALATQN